MEVEIEVAVFQLRLSDPPALFLQPLGTQMELEYCNQALLSVLGRHAGSFR